MMIMMDDADVSMKVVVVGGNAVRIRVTV